MLPPSTALKFNPRARMYWGSALNSQRSFQPMGASIYVICIILAALPQIIRS